MKKSYEAPSAEIIKFNYRDQVVAASGLLSNSGCYLPPNVNSGNNGNHYGQYVGDKANH